jgi:putative nucleotidyltransferase with HDIG domain
VELRLDQQADLSFVRKSIAQSVHELPALPGVVAKVLQETENPDACAATIERLISSEQALAAKVLRVVNSAYYGLSGQVTSLSQAVVILGMHQIRNLVLSMSAISTMQQRTAKQHETLRLFWLHSFGTAAATQHIAKHKHFNVRDAETVFVGGLLHDIGRLFLFTNFARTYDQVMKYAESRGVTIEEAEERLLGMSHGMVGALMAEHWKLPEVLIELIGGHEGPFGEREDALLYSINVGDWLTKHLYSDEETLRPSEAAPEAIAWLGFGDAELERLRRETEMKIDEAAQLFGLIAA